MMPNTEPRLPRDELQRRVLKRFSRLLDLNADLDRNGDDTRFSGKMTHGAPFAGTNHYVFDENAFELLINPLVAWRYCANFYAEDWGPVEVEGQSYSAEAGLIAAEYLFSGQLPGMVPDAPIFITEWHYFQLKKRLQTLRGQLFKKARALKGNSIAETYVNEFAFQAQLEETLSTDALLERALSLASDVTRDDLRRFMGLANNAETALRFVEARNLATRLVADQVVEPLHQLDRVYTEMLAKVRPLSAHFIPQEKDRSALKIKIEQWTETLFDTHKKADNKRRIESDAQSIAYIHWIAERRLKRDERIMLVTGDSALYEAYSSWHLRQPAGEAFLMRRINQFAPLLNPHDAPNDFQDGEIDGYQLFSSLRRAMDAPLVSFNVKRWEQREGRAYLANLLRTAEAPERDAGVLFFTRNMTTEWWEQRDATFEELREQWREAERFAIGASSPILATRAERRAAFVTHIGTAPDSLGAFTEYLSQLLDEIAQKGIQSDFPDAVAFVVNGLLSNIPNIPRAPLDIGLRIPSPDSIEPIGPEYRLTDIIERWLGGESEIISLVDPSKNSKLLDRLDIVYIVAAALAIRSENWADADRFAENAVTAAELLERNNHEGVSSTKLEAFYLSALSKRFIIASTSPRDLHTNEDIWRETLELAVNALGHMEAGCITCGDSRGVLKAISERVAVRLFHLTWRVVIPEPLLAETGYDATLLLDHYYGALDDIRHGLVIIDELRKGGNEIGPDPLIVNAASFAVLRELLNRKGQQLTGFLPHELARFEEELTLFASNLAQFPPIVGVDISAFLWLVRGQEDSREVLRTRANGNFRLKLDASLAGTFRKEAGRANRKS